MYLASVDARAGVEEDVHAMRTLDVAERLRDLEIVSAPRRLRSNRYLGPARTLRGGRLLRFQSE